MIESVITGPLCLCLAQKELGNLHFCFLGAIARNFPKVMIQCYDTKIIVIWCAL